jgi:hypothetical protein
VSAARPDAGGWQHHTMEVLIAAIAFAFAATVATIIFLTLPQS